MYQNKFDIAIIGSMGSGKSTIAKKLPAIAEVKSFGRFIPKATLVSFLTNTSSLICITLIIYTVPEMVVS